MRRSIMEWKKSGLEAEWSTMVHAAPKEEVFLLDMAALWAMTAHSRMDNGEEPSVAVRGAFAEFGSQIADVDLFWVVFVLKYFWNDEYADEAQKCYVTRSAHKRMVPASV